MANDGKVIDEAKVKAAREARELALREAEVANAESGRALGVFQGQAAFAGAQRIAQGLAVSSLVPEVYRNNIPNVLIAMELANRIGASVLMVMQHLNIIHGRPSWSSTFLIATVNSCGKFDPLDFEWEGAKGSDEWGCRAVTTRIGSDKKLRGTLITIAVAKAEGWYQKNGSKWKTIPELMLTYRAAAFWSRVYAPELSLGMHTAEELVDLAGVGGAVDLRELPKALTPGSTEALEHDLLKTPVRETVDAQTGEVLDATESQAQPWDDNVQTDAEPPEREPGEDDEPDTGTLPGVDTAPTRGKRGR